MYSSTDSWFQEYCSAVQILITYGLSGLQQDLALFLRKNAQLVGDIWCTSCEPVNFRKVIYPEEVGHPVCLYTMARHIAEEIDTLHHDRLISRDDLAPLAKALTEVEAQYLALTGLSLTGSHNRIHSVRWYISHDDLDWMYKRATNPYIPFGTNGRCRHRAKNVTEYYACQEELRMEKPRAQHMRLERLEQVRAEGRGRLSEMREVQAGRSTARKICIEQLCAMTTIERLESIARDKGTSIAYYPEDFADFPLALLEQLDPVLRTSFLLKVSRAKGGRWSQLSERINAEAQMSEEDFRSDTTANKEAIKKVFGIHQHRAK